MQILLPRKRLTKIFPVKTKMTVLPIATGNRQFLIRLKILRLNRSARILRKVLRKVRMRRLAEVQRSPVLQDGYIATLPEVRIYHYSSMKKSHSVLCYPKFL